MGVVEEAVDQGGGQALAHQLIEPGGVKVRADGEGPLLIGGVDQAVEAFGGVVAHAQQADVIDHDDVGPEHGGEGLAHRVVDPVATHQDAEVLDGEPAHAELLVDGALAQGFEQVGLAGPGRSSDTLQHLRRLLPCEVRVISPVHPLFGRLLEATGFKRWSGTVLLVVVLPDGSPGTISASATNVLGEEPPAGPATVLSVEAVGQLRTLVGALKPARRSPSRLQTRK